MYTLRDRSSQNNAPQALEGLPLNIYHVSCAARPSFLSCNCPHTTPFYEQIVLIKDDPTQWHTAYLSRLRWSPNPPVHEAFCTTTIFLYFFGQHLWTYIGLGFSHTTGCCSCRGVVLVGRNVTNVLELMLERSVSAATHTRCTNREVYRAFFKGPRRKGTRASHGSGAAAVQCPAPYPTL